MLCLSLIPTGVRPDGDHPVHFASGSLGESLGSSPSTETPARKPLVPPTPHVTVNHPILANSVSCASTRPALGRQLQRKDRQRRHGPVCSDWFPPLPLEQQPSPKQPWSRTTGRQRASDQSIHPCHHQQNKTEGCISTTKPHVRYGSPRLEAFNYNLEFD